MKYLKLLPLLACTVITACQPLVLVPDSAGQVAVCSAIDGCQTVPSKPIKITAIGYGAVNVSERYSDGQKKLLAIRASKLDAYRALVEQVYGVRITSTTTVGSLVTQNDNFRVSVDAYIRGARVVNTTLNPDGNYETTVEIELNENFFNYFRKPILVRPFPVEVHAVAPGAVGTGSVGANSPYGSTYYYAD